LVKLPDHARLLRELRLLERRTHPGGKDTVDHPCGGHDDHANAVCGVLRALSNYLGYDTSYKWLDTDTDVGVVEIPAQPLRLHPTLSNEDYERIRAPVRLGASP
jgi:hypothetical protein